MYLNIDYRRNLGGTYNKAIMQIIPTKDYTHESRSVFVYANVDGR